MTDTDGTCKYVLDPDDPETWSGGNVGYCYVNENQLNEDGVWSCPHTAKENSNLCIFHFPVDKKEDSEVVSAFLENLEKAVETTNARTQEQLLQFIGGRFGTFDLSDNPTQITVEETALLFSHAKIDGPVNWTDSSFNFRQISFSGVEFTRDADFSMVEFGGVANFFDTKFINEVDFSHTVFKSNSYFEATFDGKAKFGAAKFADRVFFTDSEFEDEARFYIADFRGGVSFQDTTIFKNEVDFGETEYGESATFDAEFKRGADFRNAEFEGDANFDEAEFQGEAVFKQTNFRRKASFVSPSSAAVFRTDDVSFVRATFEDYSDFRKVEFQNGVDFGGAEFKDFVIFSEQTLDRARFNEANLTDAMFDGAKLRESSFESTLLSRATLFGTDLRGAKLNGAVLGDIRIDEDTEFLGHPSDDSDTSPHTLSAIRTRLTCVYDPDYEEDNEHADMDKAKSVYRALEELGRKHARPRLQAHSFVRRKDLQKQDYWDDATADDASLEERLIAGARWSRARVARATLLYGESPWRVIGWSLGIILSFALLYPLGGYMKAEGASEPLSYSQISADLLSDPLGWLGGFSNILADSLYYSTLTYTALGFGDFKPVDLGRLLTSIEAGLGAVMLALLVFILGRRAAR